MSTSELLSIEAVDEVPDAAVEPWVRRLPWVVERPGGFAAGVRVFAVDCVPLGVRRVWLVTGLGETGPDRESVAVILPNYVARFIEQLGWAGPVAPLPAGHVLMKASAFADAREIEALVRTAYDYALPCVPPSAMHVESR
jgi:hypothetical protein